MSTTANSPPTRRRLAARAASVGLALLLGACAGFSPQPGPGPEPAAAYRDLTRPFIAVGDTQEHESTGYPLHDNDSAVDAYVEVAQRPPEQPLFGRRILEWALQRHPDEPYVHLGDVMDLSCRSEAERMSRIFRDAGRQGVILPGNHDGLMFGIYGYNLLDAALDPDAQRWNRACRRGAAADDARHRSADEALSKRGFIGLYVEEHARRIQDAPGLQVPPARGEHRLSWRNPQPDAFLAGIEARLLDGYRYADSFLAQLLRLPRAPGASRGVILVGLDTNQAGPLVSAWDTVMGRSPGSVGHVHNDQIDAVRPWVQAAAQRGDIVVFAGHHNWQSLGLPSRLLLGNLMSTLDQPLVYLSAHTHRGFWARHVTPP
jgi:3',5'-cyclic AMP phosphodiesterase CpdA